MAGVGSLALLAWAEVIPNDRYLLSFYDVLIATAGALMVATWQLGWPARLAVSALVSLQLLWSGEIILQYGGKSLRSALDLISKGQSGRPLGVINNPQSAQQKVTAATPRDAVILSRNYKDLLGLDRMVLSDIRAAQFYISYTGLRDARELWTLLRDRGVTHLLYPDGKRAPVRLNNTVLWAELFHRHARDVKRFGSLVLGTLPATPPPPSAPLLVLTRGVRGYKDGVYRVEQLDVDSQRHPSIPKPEPSKRATSENTAELLDRVEVVASGPGVRWTGAEQEELDSQFERVEAFDDYVIYLRR